MGRITFDKLACNVIRGKQKLEICSGVQAVVVSTLLIAYVGSIGYPSLYWVSDNF